MVLGSSHHRFLAPIAGALCILALSRPASAATEHYCGPSDLHGVYKMIDLQESPPNSMARNWKRYPFQYLAFLPDGRRYSKLISETEESSVAAAQAALAWPERQHIELDYHLSSDGVVDFNDQGTLSQRLRCFVITTAHDQMQKGDLAFSGYTRYKAQIYTLYRRWF